METVHVNHETVISAIYSGLSLDQFSAQGAIFENCRFERLKIKHAALGAGLEQTTLHGCSFDSVSLTALMGFVRFVSCAFHNAKFAHPAADYLEFVDCTFTGRIVGLEMRGIPQRTKSRYEGSVESLTCQGKTEPPALRQLVLRELNDIRGNDFTGSHLIGTSFRFGVNLSAQKLPLSDEYLYVPNAATVVPQAISALEPDSNDAARKARIFLRDVVQREIDFGQKQLLIRPKDFELRKVVPAHILLAIDALKEQQKKA